MENNKYKFKQFEHGLIAFISNFEKKINQIIEIPVLVLETGDETYWFKNKFEAKPENLNELYQKIPRLILTIDEASLQSDQDTNQYVKILYQIDNETFKSQARRKAITFPFQCNLVSSNFITALEQKTLPPEWSRWLQSCKETQSAINSLQAESPEKGE